ncbi:MAG: cupin, partial [Clostridia bacterium]|nr:cupin [Clostridia bacterium]
MNEKTGVVFSIATDNRAVTGCTISKEIYSDSDSYISYFSLAGDTDISAELYSYHKLLIMNGGGMEVITGDTKTLLDENE